MCGTKYPVVLKTRLYSYSTLGMGRTWLTLYTLGQGIGRESGESGEIEE